MKEKRIFTLSVVLVAIVFLGAVAVVSYSLKGRNVPSGNDQAAEKNSLAEQNKQDNIDALAKAEADKKDAVRPIDSTDHIWGNPDAPVKIVVYSDFECGFCERFSGTLKQIEREFADKVNVAYRHFPMYSSHPQALSAALASECAAEQGRFWEMHDKLFADNRSEIFSREQFRKDAEALELDMEKFDKCMSSEKYLDKINSQMLEARNLGIVGTPSSFINGIVFPGATPFEDFTDSEGNPMKGMKNIIENFLK